MEGLQMSNYPFGLNFSKTHSEKRIEKARKNFGANTINRLIGFAFFLLGAKRQDIAQYLQISIGTFLSFLTRTDRYGILAFEDRRKSSSFKVVNIKASLKMALNVTDQELIIQLNGDNQSIIIPRENQLQCKVILLTFLQNGLFTVKEVADALGFSVRYTKDLNTKMHDQDVTGLLDKRKGQSQDFRFTPEIKAELIQQLAANAITGKPTSSRAISQQIKERCDLVLPDRSVRLHMNKLGLSKISNSLPALVEDLKKTQNHDH